MTSAQSGHDQTMRDPARRLRVDDMAAIVARNSPGSRDASAAPMLAGGHSGRRFVFVAGVIFLLIWGALYVVFRQWRASYQERALYGATEVVPVIDPLRGVMPPGVDIDRWREAVDETRAMLVTVTASNLLDIPAMAELKVELTAHVRLGCRRPARALGELAEIWNEVADRGEFLFRDSRSISGDRHPRPKILPTYGASRVAPALDPLRVIVPAGVDPGLWRDAIDRTRGLLLAVTDASVLTVHEKQRLRADLEERVGRASGHPETALVTMAEIWDELADRGPFLVKGPKSRDGGRFPRPEIFPRWAH